MKMSAFNFVTVDAISEANVYYCLDGDFTSAGATCVRHRSES